MFTYLTSLLTSFCLYVKHWVLDHAHPFPSTGLTVYPGVKGSLQAAITLGVTSAVAIPGMVVSSDPPDDADERTCMWIDGERHFGYVAVCRYLGRLWRIHPVAPDSALVVDSLLDLMSTFNRPFLCEKMVHKEFVREHLIAYIGELDAYLEREDYLGNMEAMPLEPDAYLERGGYLGNMEAMSLADVMWYSCIKHVLHTNDIHDDFYDENERANFHTWWTEMVENDVSQMADVRMDEEKKDL